MLPSLQRNKLITTRHRKGFWGLLKKKKVQLQQTEPHVCLLDRNFNFIYCNRNCKFRKLMVTAWFMNFDIFLELRLHYKESGILSKSDLAYTFNLQINKRGFCATCFWQRKNTAQLRQAGNLWLKSSLTHSQNRARMVLVSTEKTLQLFTGQ